MIYEALLDEAYQSGLLGGTLPMYDAYMDLKNAIISDSI